MIDVITTQFQLRPDRQTVEITQQGQRIRLSSDDAWHLAAAIIATVQDQRAEARRTA